MNGRWILSSFLVSPEGCWVACLFLFSIPIGSPVVLLVVHNAYIIPARIFFEVCRRQPSAAGEDCMHTLEPRTIILSSVSTDDLKSSFLFLRFKVHGWSLHFVGLSSSPGAKPNPRNKHRGQAKPNRLSFLHPPPSFPPYARPPLPPPPA